MKQSPTPDAGSSRPERIRQMGFRPEYLTHAEQEELLELEGIFANCAGEKKRPQLAHR